MKHVLTFLLLLGFIAATAPLSAQRAIEGKSKTYHYQIRKPQKRVYSFSEGGGSIAIQGHAKGRPFAIVITPGNRYERAPRWEDEGGWQEERHEPRRRYEAQAPRMVPPFLDIAPSSLELLDDNRNRIIDAGETVFLEFELENRGEGYGRNLVAKMRQMGRVRGLGYQTDMPLGSLAPGRTRQVRIPIQGLPELTTGTAVFEIVVEEANGFGADPIEVEISTRESQKPELKINDYQLLSSSRKLVKKVPFDLQLMVQNHGVGPAEDVRVRLEMPANVILLSASDELSLGSLQSGEAQQVAFSLIVNDKYLSDEIPLTLSATDRQGRFGERKEIRLKIGQADRTLIKLEGSPQPQGEREIPVAYLGSDVDRNIPENPRVYPNRYVLAFGNEDYTTYQSQLTSEANVDYARADAQTFAMYAEKTLGVPRENITLITDGISTVMRREIKRLVDKAKYSDGEVELILYYSGHGFPDKATGEPYLMPVDIGGAQVTEGIQLSALYRELTSYPASRVTVFLDACFSGGGRNLGLLAARGVRIKPKENQLGEGNLVVFSASTGEQESLAYREKQHGMFSYWLFKKLQQSDRYLTYGELAEYLQRMVPLTSSDVNYVDQHPSINISREALRDWEDWVIK